MADWDGSRDGLGLTLDTVMSGANKTIYIHHLLGYKCDTSPRSATSPIPNDIIGKIE